MRVIIMNVFCGKTADWTILLGSFLSAKELQGCREQDQTSLTRINITF